MKKTKRQTNWILVGKVKSSSDPTREYEVKVKKDSGILSCNCPDWIFRASKEGRTCKHIRKVLDAFRSHSYPSYRRWQENGRVFFRG